MNYREMYRYVLDKTDKQEQDRQTDNIIHTAINAGYIDVSKHDATPNEVNISPIARVNALPEDFLIELAVYHNSYGLLDESQYRVSGNKLLLANNVILYNKPSDFIEGNNLDSIDVVYGVMPELLKEDEDIPVVNEQYHMAICYYALYEITNNPNYHNLYTNIIQLIPQFELFTDDASSDEYVRDVVKRW